MKPGTEYEQFVKAVYEAFLAQDGLTINVETHKILKGKSGANHEIDVYWQFEIAGKIYKTAVECKHYNSTVEKGHVQEFWAKLDDIGDISGIMATKKGYQKGALTFGHYNKKEILNLIRSGCCKKASSLVIFLFTLQIILRGLITEKQMKIYPCWSLKKSMCLLIKVINLVRIHMP